MKIDNVFKELYGEVYGEVNWDNTQRDNRVKGRCF